MKVDVLDNYPPQIKEIVNDYNKAVDAKDIMEVDLAINGLVAIVFGADEDVRFYAIQVLSKISTLQYKFLKNAVKALIHRYKGDDPAKSELASQALGQIVVGKPGAQLIEEPELLEKITGEERERLSRSKADDERKAAFIERVKNVQLDLSLVQAFPEIYKTGLFINKCLLDEKNDDAFQALEGLVGGMFKWHSDIQQGKTDAQKSEAQKNFAAGCMLLSIIGDSAKRPVFFKGILDYIMGFLQKGKEEQKKIAQEILLNSYEKYSDLLEVDLVNWLRAENVKRKEERDKQLKEESERKQYLKKVMVTPKLKWASDVQKLAKDYNEAVQGNNQKILFQIVKSLEKNIESNDESLWMSTGEFIAELLNKVPDMVKGIVSDLLKDYRKPKPSEILSFMLTDIATLQLTKEPIIQAIKEDQKAREEQRESLKKQKEEEHKKIEEITIKFEGDWDKKLIKLCESINEMFLKKNETAAQKLIDKEFKDMLLAKDETIRSAAQQIFVNLAEKYPQVLSNIIPEYLELFNSDNPAKFVAVEAFGKVYHAGFLKKILPNADEEFTKKVETAYDDRRKEIENIQMAEKISQIKIDVQTIPINEEWPKDVQKIARAYNDAILKQNMQSVMEEVKKITDIFMYEKKEERLNTAIDIIGLISKKNIELIAPTIDIFLQMVEAEDTDKKYRAIKALGEISVQRPGWAYMGIDKLITTANKDKNEDARMKAMLELSRIGAKDPVMLVEYVPNIIEALASDPNKHVRRLAAFTLGAMAEAIPLEAKDAIPALTDALHDDYMLVRKFADKALGLIRAAMRKE